MGSALIRGVSKSGIDCKLYAYDKDTEKLDSLSDTGAVICSSASELVSKCRYVLLAVKPQVLGDVLDSIKHAVTPDTIFISICAGISAEYIRSRTIPEVKVILVMPNTPMMLGMGASAISSDTDPSDGNFVDDFDFAMSVLRSCGIAEYVPITKMKEIIAINGSSPAFIYLFAKGFIDYAREQGIDEITATDLFAATLAGSAKMLTESGMTVDELIKQVSSPGGTTIAGLEKLYDGKLLDTVKAACEACTKRAYELGK